MRRRHYGRRFFRFPRGISLRCLSSARDFKETISVQEKEIDMSPKHWTLLFAALIVSSCVSFAQEQPQDQNKAVIQHVPISATSPASGKQMFTAYCAVCHGTEGNGNGPAASALKTAPSDLTQLTKENGGKFPAMKVSSVIRGTADLPAHGSKDMPVWGELFWSMSHGQESQVQQRVSNLTHYIESIQAK
jgi:mono/diheme cytochrome c family protein